MRRYNEIAVLQTREKWNKKKQWQNHSSSISKQKDRAGNLETQ